jgi:hypothetical protein
MGLAMSSMLMEEDIESDEVWPVTLQMSFEPIPRGPVQVTDALVFSQPPFTQQQLDAHFFRDLDDPHRVVGWQTLCAEDRSRCVRLMQEYRDQHHINYDEQPSVTWVRMAMESVERRRTVARPPALVPVEHAPIRDELVRVRDELRQLHGAVNLTGTKHAVSKAALDRVEISAARLERTSKDKESAIGAVEQRLAKLEAAIEERVSPRLGSLEATLAAIQAAGQRVASDVAKVRSAVETDSTMFVSLHQSVANIRAMLEKVDDVLIRENVSNNFVVELLGHHQKDVLLAIQRLEVVHTPPPPVARPPPPLASSSSRGVKRNREVDALVKGMLSESRMRTRGR